MNPLEILTMLKKGYNPQQIVGEVLNGQFAQTPMGANLKTLAEQGNTAGIENIARNMCKERGLDFDKEFNSFKSQLGIK